MSAAPILLDRAAVCAALAISPATLQRLVARGALAKPRRISAEGRRVAWLRKDVEKFAESLPESDVAPPASGSKA
jgi:predicted DNA-binding transcriptional regulator AlpA